MKSIPLVDLGSEHEVVAAEVQEAWRRVPDASAGPQVGESGREYAEFVGVRHCVGVANSTDAIINSAEVSTL